MKIILNNGKELSPILVTGGTRMVQGASRDTLNFIFPATEDMAELDSAFSAENCEKITIIGDDGRKREHPYRLHHPGGAEQEVCGSHSCH